VETWTGARFYFRPKMEPEQSKIQVMKPRIPCIATDCIELCFDNNTETSFLTTGSSNAYIIIIMTVMIIYCRV
jgi:hypothetical protein